MKDFNEGVEEVLKLLETNVQAWLMGAGVSFDAKIPLMYQLTERVGALVQPPHDKLLKILRDDLPTDAHIEHVLSHLGDLIAIASRGRQGKVSLGGQEFDVASLNELHATVIRHIAETVRYGYKSAVSGAPEEVGSLESPIVEVSHHKAFMDALFAGRANLESRSRVVFVTTNYDTLIEDALSLSRRRVFDGFSNGGIGFWTGHRTEDAESLPPRSHQVIKLHGSVDWLRAQDGTLVRARYGTNYLSKLEDTLIYPQATKYVETQKDPFAGLFDAFRRVLHSSESHVLCVVGYSFGDEHINLEIEDALLREGNKTNVIAFVREVDSSGVSKLPDRLEAWQSAPFKSRIYVATDKALYTGGKRLVHDSAANLPWWSFGGLTSFLKTGTIK